MAAAQEMGIPVSMDVNYREALWSPAEARAVCDRMREHATLFKVGHDEAETIWGGDMTASQHARRFVVGSTRLAIVTTGDSGAVAFDGNQVVEHTGFNVEVVDPVGAGDAFVAGALAGIFQTRVDARLPGYVSRQASRRSSGQPWSWATLPARWSARAMATPRRCRIWNRCGSSCVRRGEWDDVVGTSAYIVVLPGQSRLPAVLSRNHPR